MVTVTTGLPSAKGKVCGTVETGGVNWGGTIAHELDAFLGLKMLVLSAQPM